MGKIIEVSYNETTLSLFSSVLLQRIQERIAERPNETFFSFEYFPPKTESGLANLYERFDRMRVYNPMWIDVTWGAGGSTADKTIEICTRALKQHHLEPMMHLTCTNMHKEMIDKALKEVRKQYNNF